MSVPNATTTGDHQEFRSRLPHEAQGTRLNGPVFSFRHVVIAGCLQSGHLITDDA
jgi:hypothetical protein